MGPRPLVNGPGDLASAGRPAWTCPARRPARCPAPEDKDSLSLAIGQGGLRATPLQVLCMMAAVANGGRLLTPHLAGRAQCPHARRRGRCRRRRACRARRLATLPAVREGLRRVVADAAGTAHATAYVGSIAIAGKTGTAETGVGRASHAWFAGYAPADGPKLAFVIVLEHAGDAAAAAGPVARRLVLRMEQLGLL